MNHMRCNICNQKFDIPPVAEKLKCPTCGNTEHLVFVAEIEFLPSLQIYTSSLPAPDDFPVENEERSDV